MSLHSFDPEIAARVGVNAAVIYQNILFWTQKNLANERHIHDGKVWTYNSLKAFGELFDYLTQDQIRRALGKLVDAGLICEGNFNRSTYDRTKWYGVSCSIHSAKTTNGTGKNPKPIPDSKPDTNPDTKPDKGRRAVSLPPNWVPSDRNIQDALDRDFTEKEIHDEADRFRDYHIAKGTTFKDWDAGWRTWLGNSRKFASSRNTGRGGGVDSMLAGFAAFANSKPGGI